MKEYVSQSVEVIAFEEEISTTIAQSRRCNCQAQQYKDDHSLNEGCELTSYGFIEIGDHY